MRVLTFCYIRQGNLKLCCLRKAMSMSDVARKINVSPYYFKQIVEQNKPISLDMQKKILNLFRYDAHMKKYKQLDENWFDVLFETKIKYIKENNE